MKVEMVKAKLNERYDIILPKHRADREEWYTEQGWERKRLDSMHLHLNPKVYGSKHEVMYYVGVEEGEMTALCQMWGAQVVMFEPNPKVWPNIKAIWEANKLDHPLGIFAGFASDKSVIAAKPMDFADEMHIGEDHWPKCASNEVIGNHGFKELDKEAGSYDQIKIDDYVAQTHIVPTAISMDIEGAEGMALRGAEETLRNHHPKIWLSGHPEFLHDNFNGGGGFEYLRELRDWLKKDLGYKEEILDYDHEVHLFYYI